MGLELLPPLLQGLGVTIAMTAVATAVALLLGIVLCALRTSALRVLSLPALLLIAVLRNTPLLLQLLFWYFGASQWLPNALRQALLQAGSHCWPGFETLVAVLGLSIYSMAFVAEELRAGLAAVPRGQGIAAAVLGLTPRQAWRHVVLPQAWRIARQPLIGQVMNIAKNSSLAMAIGVAELAYRTRQVESQTFRSFEVYAWSTVLYVLLVAAIGAYGQWRGRHDHLRLQARG